MGAIQQALLSYGKATNTALRDLILANGPVNYWRNAEASGSVMEDEVATDGGYIGGVLLGRPPLYPGGPTSAGSNFDNVHAGDSSAVPASLASMTLITIIRPTNLTGIKLVGVQRDENGTTRLFQWRSNGSAIEFINLPGATLVSSPASVLAINTTYLVGFEVDALGNYAMYVNGVSVKTGTLPPADYGGVGDPYRIGYSAGPDVSLTGTTCENAVFDKVLGPTVHAALFAATGL